VFEEDASLIDDIGSSGIDGGIGGVGGAANRSASFRLISSSSSSTSSLSSSSSSSSSSSFIIMDDVDPFAAASTRDRRYDRDGGDKDKDKDVASTSALKEYVLAVLQGCYVPVVSTSTAATAVTRRQNEGGGGGGGIGGNGKRRYSERGVGFGGIGGRGGGGGGIGGNNGNAAALIHVTSKSLLFWCRRQVQFSNKQNYGDGGGTGRDDDAGGRRGGGGVGNGDRSGYNVRRAAGRQSQRRHERGADRESAGNDHFNRHTSDVDGDVEYSMPDVSRYAR
jgi:hypothetical protein